MNHCYRKCPTKVRVTRSFSSRSNEENEDMNSTTTHQKKCEDKDARVEICNLSFHVQATNDQPIRKGKRVRRMTAKLLNNHLN